MNPEQTVRLINILTNKRRESHLSVNEVARRARVDPGTVSRIEGGLIPTPRADSLKAIGKVLGIPALDLFTIVGWVPSGELPSFGIYIRAKYNQLPEAILQEIEAHFDIVASRWGVGARDDGHSVIEDATRDVVFDQSELPDDPDPDRSSDPLGKETS